MSSQKQIEANRLNALKSTGPRTPEGKAASSHNAVTHGLRARAVVLPGEDQQAFDQLLQQLRDEYQPQTPSEALLVEQAAGAWWKLARITSLEQSFWHKAILETPHSDWFQNRRRQLNKHHLAQEVPLAEHLRIDIFAENTSTLDRLARFESRYERAFHRALRDLQRLQAVRRQLIPGRDRQGADTTPKALPQLEPVEQSERPVSGVPGQPAAQPQPPAPLPTPNGLPETPAASPNHQNLDERTHSEAAPASGPPPVSRLTEGSPLGTMQEFLESQPGDDSQYGG